MNKKETITVSIKLIMPSVYLPINNGKGITTKVIQTTLSITFLQNNFEGKLSIDTNKISLVNNKTTLTTHRTIKAKTGL